MFLVDLDSVSNFWSSHIDSGLGVVVVGCLKKFVDLFLLLILFYFGMKISVNLRFLTRFARWNSDSICRCGLFNISSPPMIEKWEVVKETVNRKDEDDDDAEQVFDINTLRRLVKMERQRAKDANLELEKERMASTTAAEEAMAMILRLQNEKSVLEMEAQQHRRLSHEKQLHDQEVIQSLRWIILKHESERSLLESRLKLCKQRLKIYVNGDGEEGCEGSLSYLEEGLVSSLDLGLSPCYC